MPLLIIYPHYRICDLGICLTNSQLEMIDFSINFEIHDCNAVIKVKT